MSKRYTIEAAEALRRAEELVSAAPNRYRITNRAKLRRYDEADDYDDHFLKPIIRAIVEMSDELTQPEILSD